MSWLKLYGVNKMSVIHFSIFLGVFCLGTWGLVVGGVGHAKEIFLGMVAPLTIGVLSMILLNNTHQRTPEKVNKFMITLFAGKMVFYALYFIFIFTFYTFNTLPFIISFVGYFITLHISEALFLRSIFK